MYESNYDCIWLQLSRTSRIYECLSEIIRKSYVEINAFTVFCVCSSNYKKILLINPFDSPFYELLPLLIFASFIDFLPSLSLQLHTGRKKRCKLNLSREIFQFQESLHEVTLHSLEPRLYPANIGKWRSQEEPNMAYFETTSFFPTKDVVDVICRILLIRQLWFSFRWRVFLSMVNIRRHFDWKCHRQLLVTHLWKILLSWLQFYAVERANCKKLQR